MIMRKNEIEAVECFRDYLEAKGLDPEDWIEGEDPPECYLVVSTTKYAVEVMRLVDDVTIDGNAVSRASYTEPVFSLISGIEKNAQERKHLTGSYEIWFCGPFDDFSKMKKKILEKALRFIESSADHKPGCLEYIVSEDEKGCMVEGGPEHLSPEYLQGVQKKFCVITKSSSSPDRIVPRLDSPHWISWRQEIIDEACSKLQEAICIKSHKLRKIDLPKVLILPDLFRYMDTDIYRECLDDLKFIDEFHTIFLIDGNRKGYVLHSEEGAWA